MALFIDTQADLRDAGVPISGKNFSLPPFEPYLRSTWSELFPQFVGRAFTESLETASADGGLLSGEYKALKPYLIRPLGQLAFAEFLPFAEVSMDDAGITTQFSQERKPATERQIHSLRKALLEGGWKHLENLLAYLDYHHVDFPEYVQFRAEQTPSLLPTAAEFSKYYQIFGSRLTFQAIKSTAELIEAETIIPRLGDRWPDLLTSTDPAAAGLLRQLRVYLANKTVEEAIPSLAIEISGAGLKVHYKSDVDNIDYFTPPTEAQVTRLLEKVKAKADAAWVTIGNLLDDTPDADQGRGVFDNEGS